MRLAFLGSPDSWYLADLCRAAESGWEIVPLGFPGLNSRVHAGETRVYGGASDLREFDAILVRSMPLGTLEQVVFRMNALAMLETAGSVVINAPRSLEIAIDKYLALTQLQSLGLLTPETACCQSAVDAMQHFERLGGDVVVKPVFGGEGRGIMRITEKETAARVFHALQQIGSVIYLQTYVKHAGHDIRLFVAGSEVLGMERVPTNDWRTNISRGGTARAHRVTPAERQVALAVADRFGASICAIDLLPTNEGKTYALEVNAVPGWRSLAQVVNVDVAELVLRHIGSVVEKSAGP